MADRIETPPGCFAALLWSAGFILVVNAGIVLINYGMMPFGSGGTLFLGWLLVVALSMVSMAAISGKCPDRIGIFVPILLFAFFDLLYAVLGGHLPKLLKFRETQVIAVREADRPPNNDCDVFHFSDGKVSLRHVISRKVPGRRWSRYRHVAPVLPEGWNESEAVTLWVAQEGQDEFPPAAWGSDFRGGYSAATDPDFRKQIEDRASRRRLVASPGAPIIYWSGNPREDFKADLNLELWSLLAVDALALAALLGPLLLGGRATSLRK